MIKVAIWILAGIVGAVSPAGARPPVQLGFVYIMSGAYAGYGEDARRGALLAADEINRRGGIDGRPVITWFENSRSRTGLAEQALRRLVRERRVDGLVGIDSSKVAQHIAPVIAELKTPLIITNAATPEVTGSLCNRYLFRISLNLAQTAKAAALLAAESATGQWTTVGKKHVYSEQAWDYFRQYLRDLSPGSSTLPDDHTVFIPSRQKDFTPYLEKLKRHGADGVLVTLWGGYLRRFIRQADALGLFDTHRRFLLTMGASLDTLYGLEDNLPEGLWVSAPYWFLASRSAKNRRFVADYYARFNKYPSHLAHGAYAAVQAYAAAAARAGSTDKEAVAAALSGLTLDLPGGRTTLRTSDHQAVADLWWGRTFADPAYPIRILKPLKKFKGATISRPPAATGCNLP